MLEELFTHLSHLSNTSSSIGQPRVLSQTISASFVEIYNEHLTDLLANAGDPLTGAGAATPRHKAGWDDKKTFDDGQNLPLRYDRARGWFVEGVMEEVSESTTRLRRKTGP